VPPEGIGFAEYLEGKYGPEALDGMARHLGEAAAADGLPMLDLRTLERRPNTFLAHRLLAGALEEGEDEDGEVVRQSLQQRVGLGLLAAYWGRGEDVGDREVLEGVAEAAGMPAERVVAALDDDLTTTAVRLDENRAAKLGIRAVPAFVFGRRFAVSGAQPVPALAEAARRGLTGA
jgi:predicted DsbA family dithiol-disulfide isomerase